MSVGTIPNFEPLKDFNWLMHIFFCLVENIEAKMGLSGKIGYLQGRDNISPMMVQFIVSYPDFSFVSVSLLFLFVWIQESEGAGWEWERSEEKIDEFFFWTVLNSLFPSPNSHHQWAAWNNSQHLFCIFCVLSPRTLKNLFCSPLHQSLYSILYLSFIYLIYCLSLDYKANFMRAGIFVSFVLYCILIAYNSARLTVVI